ncbi:MAG: outer membrane protein assembly factor [Balneolales bacterium]|nr:outer membrane protein assembly factor [Balneolales bacterium]
MNQTLAGILCFRILLLATVALLTLHVPGHTVQPDSVRYAFIPSAGISADSGIGGGLLLQRQTYRDDIYPFRSLVVFKGYAFSKGIYNFDATVELYNESGDRMEFSLVAIQEDNAHFFGIGPGTPFSATQFDDQFYDYRRQELDLNFEYGTLIAGSDSRRRTEVFVGIAGGYMEASRLDGRFIEEADPPGIKGGWRSRLYTGLMSDRRDDRFRPEAGYRVKVQTGLLPQLAGNRENLGRLTAEASIYQGFRFLHDAVFASRIQYVQAVGKAPFYELSSLGGEYSLRGAVPNRYMDMGSLLMNIELRTWLFSLPFWEIEIGGQLFTDGGTVFETPASIKPLSDFRFTLGFGGALSIFNPDFILRGDVGFSHETWRFYTGIGYMF